VFSREALARIQWIICNCAQGQITDLSTQIFTLVIRFTPTFPGLDFGETRAPEGRANNKCEHRQNSWVQL
jgi:hypothetical protein